MAQNEFGWIQIRDTAAAPCWWCPRPGATQWHQPFSSGTVPTEKVKERKKKKVQETLLDGLPTASERQTLGVTPAPYPRQWGSLWSSSTKLWNGFLPWRCTGTMENLRPHLRARRRKEWWYLSQSLCQCGSCWFFATTPRLQASQPTHLRSGFSPAWQCTRTRIISGSTCVWTTLPVQLQRQCGTLLVSSTSSPEGVQLVAPLGDMFLATRSSR